MTHKSYENSSLKRRSVNVIVDSHSDPDGYVTSDTDEGYE